MTKEERWAKSYAEDDLYYHLKISRKLAKKIIEAIEREEIRFLKLEEYESSP